MSILSNFTETRSSTESARILESTFCKIVDRGASETIVSFAAIDCPPGRFFTSRIFAKIPQNVVFLNCPDNSWYLDGIPGLGGSIEEAAQGLQSILEQLGLRETRRLFWGGSMGGFGAVVFGALTHADHVVASGAELALLVEGGNSELILKKRGKRVEFPQLPVESWVRDSGSRYHLYCGEFAYHDLVSAKRVLDLPDVEVTTLDGFGHPLPGYIEDVYGLHAFLLHHLNHNTCFHFTRGEIGKLGAYSDWWEDLHAASLNLGTHSKQRLLQGLEGKDDVPPELACHCAYALSCGETVRGGHDAAVAFAREAIRIGGQGCFPYYRYAKALHAAGAPVAIWLDVARKIEDLKYSRWFEFGGQLVKLIVNGYSGSGDPCGAAEYIAAQRELAIGQPKRIELLDRLSSKGHAAEVWNVKFTKESSSFFISVSLDYKKVAVERRVMIISGTLLAELPGNQITEVFMAREAGTIVMFRMDHESPALAKRRPDLPHAATVRFRIKIALKSGIPRPVRLVGTTAGGRSMEWLEMHREESS